MAAVSAAKLGWFVHTRDMHLRLECVSLSSLLFSTAFTLCLPHGQRCAEFAGYIPREVIVGSDLFGEPHTVEAATMVQMLTFVSAQLMANELFLEALPVLSLLQARL